MMHLIAMVVLALAPQVGGAAEMQTGSKVGTDQYLQVGRLLKDPRTGIIERNKTIVVRHGRILKILDGFHEAENVVDLQTSFVLPGLIDSHTHVSMENGPEVELGAVKNTGAASAMDGLFYSRQILEAGFTTIVDLAGNPEAVFAVRDAIAAQKVMGPRIIAAGVVAAHGGHGDVHGFRPDVTKVLSSPWRCSGADDCSRAVRQAVQSGADLIKIASTGGVVTNASTGLEQQMSDEELEAIVRTAHSLGRRVTCHAHGTNGINAALKAGVDSIEHGTFLDADSIRMMKSRGVYLVPTLLAGDTVRQQAETAEWMPPAVRDKALAVGPAMIAAARRARGGGVKIAFGTDSGISAHGKNAGEFALMVQAGFSPLDAIRAATVWGAEHIGLENEIGSLAPGKAADLIAVAGDPLDDIMELERVQFVMKSGKVVKDRIDP